jgi:hypothetical protein
MAVRSICFLLACPRSACAAVCSVLAAYVLLAGAFLAADAVPAVVSCLLVA